MARHIKQPVRLMDPELKVPLPCGNPPKKMNVRTEADILQVLADDYFVNPGLHMTVEDLKEKLDISDDRLNEYLLQLENKNLAALHRNRHGLPMLARATYKGIAMTNPLENYKYIPSWVDQKDMF
jgi:hypothetical protein